MRPKLFHAAIYAILGIMIATTLLAIVWLLWPYKTADITTPIPVLNKTDIRPGGKIKMELAITKYHNYPVTGLNSIVCNNRLFVISTMNQNSGSGLPVGEYTRINEQIMPPDALPGSKCHFQFRVNYKVNPIRDVIKQWDSEEWIVK